VGKDVDKKRMREDSMKKKKKKKKKPGGCQLTKALRIALSMTQQQFAVKMEWSISSVVRYETSRPPRGHALVELERVAVDSNFDDFSRCLRLAIRRDLGIIDALIRRMAEDLEYYREKRENNPEGYAEARRKAGI
jgi:transcriptional regulator with XRE-family HTH domain